MHETGVHIQITATAADGTTRFVDETIPYIDGGAPFQMTAAMPATQLSFRWTPVTFDMDYHLSPRRRLVLVLEGGLEIILRNGESRLLRPGDIYSLRDTWGEGHRSRSADGRPFRSAFIALDDQIVLDRREPMPSPDVDGVDYIHNQETPEGVSFFERKRLPYLHGGQEGKETGQIALKSFQFVKAPANLDYDWHPAPQRQAVLVLTGGLAVGYGDGSGSTVQPGGFLIGEDVKGKGHKTRALEGRERFSIFAHLA